MSRDTEIIYRAVKIINSDAKMSMKDNDLDSQEERRMVILSNVIHKVCSWIYMMYML